MLEKKEFWIQWLEWGESFSIKPIFNDFIVNVLKNMADIITWTHTVISSFLVTAKEIDINYLTI